MFRNTLLRSSKRILQSPTRSFTTSSNSVRTPLSKWVLPSTVVSIGLATIYLSQPLSLDSEPKKAVPKKKEAEESQNKSPEGTTTEEKPASEETEGEPKQQAAYNPETGEINWDCPCLGGMAHGPCGEEFKEAFSCFVYSEAEPKGFDCIDKFKNMQNCFRKYPEIYSEEIRDDESPVDHLEPEPESAAPAETTPVQETPVIVEEVFVEVTPKSDSETSAQELIEEIVVVPVAEVPSADTVPPVTEEISK